MEKSKKILTIILIAVAIIMVGIFVVVFSSAIHEYAFPKWYDNAKIIAIDYAKTNESLIDIYGDDFDIKAIGYRYEHGESRNHIILQIEDSYYRVYIEEYDSTCIATEIEETEPPSWVD